MPNGCQPNAQWYAGSFGANADEIQDLFDSIILKGVASKRGDGAIYNRRMVRDAEAARARIQHGRDAANARWNAQTMPDDGPPSASASASASAKEKKETSADGLRLAEFVWTAVSRNHPNLPSLKTDRGRKLATWAAQIDGFLKRTGKSVAEVQKFLAWAAQDRQQPRDDDRREGRRPWLGWQQQFRSPGILGNDSAWIAFDAWQQAHGPERSAPTPAQFARAEAERQRLREQDERDAEARCRARTEKRSNKGFQRVGDIARAQTKGGNNG